jgi:hypothetical protein
MCRFCNALDTLQCEGTFDIRYIVLTPKAGPTLNAMLTTLAIANYRSLREFIVPLGALNVITGPNGSGKSNVYRALRLLALTAKGGLIPSLAREGGLSFPRFSPMEMAGAVIDLP